MKRVSSRKSGVRSLESQVEKSI